MQTLQTRPIKKIIDEYMKVASVAGMIWRAHEIASISGIKMQRSILDLGCGDGRFAKIVFTDRLDWGLDISKELINQAKTNKAYKNYILADAHKIPLEDSSVQTVFSNSVFEHISNLIPVLAEINRVLKPGGTLIFTTHSPLSKKFYGVYLLKKIGLISLAKIYQKIFCKMLQIRTVWNLETWERKLKESGFIVEESKKIISPYFAFWFEILLPLAFLQNRIGILKKIPLTKAIFFTINPNFTSTNRLGRNFYIKAKKLTSARQL